MNRVLLPTAPCLRRPPHGPVVALAGPTMGVEWRVRACLPPGLESEDLHRRIQRLLDRLVMQMSGWESRSNLCRYNRAPAGEWVELPPELLHVVDSALTWAERSGGAFDPTIGRLVELWGFGATTPAERPPPADALKAARADAGWRRLKRDHDARRLFQPGGVWLDLSGIAKGFAVDALSRALTAIGARDHLVEIGGELRGEGLKPDGQPWWVQLADAGAARTPLIAGLTGLSVATSGDSRCDFVLDGVRYGHTLDPRTGAPTRSAVASASVLHAKAMVADVAATILMVLQPTEALAFAEAHDLAARLLVRSDDGLVERFSPAALRMLA